MRLNILKINLDNILTDIVAISGHNVIEIDISTLNFRNNKICSFFTRYQLLVDSTLILVKILLKFKKHIISEIKDVLVGKKSKYFAYKITINICLFILVCLYISLIQQLIETLLDGFDCITTN